MALYPATAGCRMSVQMGNPADGTEHVNVFHFAKRDGTPMTQADLIALVADWRLNISASYRALFYTDMPGIVFTLETLSPEPRIGISDSGALNGTRTPDGDLLPRFTCLRVSWAVGYLSRRWRGKTYLGGLREQDQAAGQADSVYMDLVSSWAGAMVIRYGQSGSNATFVFCILSDPDGVLPKGNVEIGQVAPQLASVQSSQHYSILTSLRRRAR